MQTSGQAAPRSTARVADRIRPESSRIGGLAHILLPSEGLSLDSDNRAKFPSTAVPLLLEEMRKRGAWGRPIAKIVGGASMFASLLPSGGINMGERNVEGVVLERQLLCARLAHIDARMAAGGRLHERRGRVDGGDIGGTGPLDQLGGQRARPAADVEDPLPRPDIGQIGELR